MPKKYIKIAVFVLLVIGTFGFMFWYVNQYLFKFFAGTNSVSVTMSTVNETQKVGEEFQLSLHFSGQQMKGAELYLIYDPTILQYFKDYDNTDPEASGIVVVPPGYFDLVVIEKTADEPNPPRPTSGNNNPPVFKEVTAILVNSEGEFGNSVDLNFKFKPIKTGATTVTLADRSAMLGGAEGNTAVTFELTPASATKVISIVDSSDITPTQAPPPVGYWKMDDNVSGNGKTVTDSSGNNNHGTTIAGQNTTGMDCTVAGKFDGACNFDGSDDYVSIGDINQLDRAGSFTISGWVNTETLKNYGSVVTKENGATNRIWLGESAGALGGNDDVILVLANGSNTYSYTTGNILNNGTWNYWTMVYDGSGNTNADKLKFFFNAIEQPLTFVGMMPSTAPSNGANLEIGADASHSRFLDGSIDDLRIYNYALTPEQIIADMNSGSPGPTEPEPTEPEPTEPPDITSPPISGESQVTLNLKLRFQGITKQPAEANRTMDVAVAVAPVPIAYIAREKTVKFTGQSDGTWTGTVTFDDLPSYFAGTIYIKGPKHIKKKICSNNPTETISGGYRCKSFELLNIKGGENNLDLSGIILFAGDLPIQNGVVDAVDIAFIRQNLTNKDGEKLQRGDLNLDGIIDTQDFSMVLAALGFKFDEE